MELPDEKWSPPLYVAILAGITLALLTAGLGFVAYAAGAAAWPYNLALVGWLLFQIGKILTYLLEEA